MSEALTPVASSDKVKQEEITNDIIDRIKASPIVYKGQPVLTLSMIDQLHDRPKGTARKRLHDNRSRFVEGKHFWEMTTESEIRTRLIEQGFLGARAGKTILVTECGYLMLTKSMTDDLSWKVQEQLVENYFRKQEPKTSSQTQLILAMAQELAQQEARALEAQKQLQETSDRVEKLEGAVTSLESRRLDTKRRDEYTCKELALIAGWFSRTGNPHEKAVAAITKQHNFLGRKLARWADSFAGDGRGYPQIVFSEAGRRVFIADIETMFQGQEYFKFRASKNYHVFRNRSGKEAS